MKIRDPGVVRRGGDIVASAMHDNRPTVGSRGGATSERGFSANKAPFGGGLQATTPSLISSTGRVGLGEEDDLVREVLHIDLCFITKRRDIREEERHFTRPSSCCVVGATPKRAARWAAGAATTPGVAAIGLGSRA